MKHTWIYVLTVALVGWVLPLGVASAAPLDHRVTGGTGYATASALSSKRATKPPMLAAAELDDQSASEQPGGKRRPAEMEPEPQPGS